MIDIAFDIDRIRKDFPILQTQVYGKPLIYFDNAATSQKPRQVLERLEQYYRHENSNIHRAFYKLSQDATDAYEGARITVQGFINAPSTEEIIYVRGATEGINLVASSWGRKFLNEGDEVIVSHMEHHANLVPWQLICEERGAKLKIIPVDERGELDMEAFAGLFTEKTKLLSVVWVSNSIGTINPIKDLIAGAKAHHVPVMVDACQAAPHLPIDVQDLGCDFLVFSGHKVFAPTGIGILWAKKHWLEEMPPYQSGGDMVDIVTLEKTTFAAPPHKFEAGTPHIAGVVGLATAIDYVRGLGRDEIHRYENHLRDYMREKLLEMEEVRIIGTAKEKIPVFSLDIAGAHPLDLGTMLDFEGVAVRTGNHCTQPLLNRFGVSATCRASLAFYNSVEEIDRFIAALKKVIPMVR